MKNTSKKLRLNQKLARQYWGSLSKNALLSLRELSVRFALSIAEGHLQFLNGHWYVTHAGLLRIAQNRGCFGIDTAVQEALSSPLEDRWVFKAIVYKNRESKGFVGFGDANPSSVSATVLGAELRIAETRAVNRALRKAYGIGLCSIEELPSAVSLTEVPSSKPHQALHHNGDGGMRSQPRLRDRLSMLIRKYQLDADLVKRYAADFCGTEVLRDASRDLVETFVARLTEQAADDLSSLTCKLNSYGRTQEKSL